METFLMSVPSLNQLIDHDFLSSLIVNILSGDWQMNFMEGTRPRGIKLFLFSLLWKKKIDK